MQNRDKSELITRYRERIEKFGHGAAALGEPRERQPYFFHFVVGADGFEKSDSVLDVGCGYGDLSSYLNSAGQTGKYTGIDVNPLLIEEGRRRYPNTDLRVVDIQQESLSEQFDWCVACGVLTAKIGQLEYLEHVNDLLHKMWRLTRKGLMFNLLSPLADETHPYHARPAFGDVLAVMTRITNRFTLRHDYMPYDYAMYLYKDNAVDRSTLIFSAHEQLLAELQRKWRAGNA